MDRNWGWVEPALIGPKGEITKQKIELALNNNVIDVSLGETRLRNETANTVAAAILRYKEYFLGY